MTGRHGSARLEALSDKVEDRSANDPGFRLVTLSMEAVLPKEELSEEERAGEEEESKIAGRISREELHEDIAHASQLPGVYLLMVALSTVVAAIGLIRGDLAIVIGSMVIAPLLGPNISLSLACALGTSSWVGDP